MISNLQLKAIAEAHKGKAAAEPPSTPLGSAGASSSVSGNRSACGGLARTGSYMSNGSGDFVIAFSTRNPETPAVGTRSRQVEVLSNDHLSPLLLAVVESVEEAVYNSLTKATTVTGRDGHQVEAIPIDALRRILTPE